MKKYMKLLAVIAALALILCACGGTAKSDRGSSAASFNTSAPESYDYNGFAGKDAISYESERQNSKSSSGNTSESAFSRVYENTKVIYTANFRLQTTEFEETQALLETLVLNCGGYFENANVYNDSIYKSTSYKAAEYTVRVPSEKYQSFLAGVSEKCHVISLSQNSKDVGEEYFNTEQRLQTLNNKHERLEALLKEAATMNDIIQLEDALSDCEYEINRLQTTLNRYDSLIGFSTVTISLQEVERPDSGIDEQPGFLARLGRSFAEGFERFTEGAEDLALWLSGHILTLVVLVIIIVALIKIKPIRRIREKADRRYYSGKQPLRSETPAAPQEQTDASEK